MQLKVRTLFDNVVWFELFCLIVGQEWMLI
jgi:hypothetical protein